MLICCILNSVDHLRTDKTNFFHFLPLHFVCARLDDRVLCAQCICVLVRAYLFARICSYAHKYALLIHLLWSGHFESCVFSSFYILIFAFDWGKEFEEKQKKHIHILELSTHKKLISKS